MIIKPMPGVVKPSKAANMIYKNIPIDNNQCNLKYLLNVYNILALKNLTN